MRAVSDIPYRKNERIEGPSKDIFQIDIMWVYVIKS